MITEVSSNKQKDALIIAFWRKTENRTNGGGGIIPLMWVIPEANAGDANVPTASLQSAKQVKTSSEARQIGRFQAHCRLWGQTPADFLPPTLGGLRFRAPPVPGHCAPGSMVKISWHAVSRKTRKLYYICPFAVKSQSSQISSGSMSMSFGQQSVPHSTRTCPKNAGSRSPPPNNHP